MLESTSSRFIAATWTEPKHFLCSLAITCGSNCESTHTALPHLNVGKNLD